jgi:hypothetical protein
MRIKKQAEQWPDWMTPEERTEASGLARELQDRADRGEISPLDARSPRSVNDAMQVNRERRHRFPDPHYDDYDKAFNDFEHQQAYEEAGVDPADTARLGWGSQKPSPEKVPPPPVRNDDVRLIQPEESGLEYPAIVRRNPKGDGWDVMKPL